MLLRGRDVMTRRQIGNDLLPDPSTIQQSGLRIGEAPFEVHHQAIIRGLSAQVIWILKVKLFIRAACAALSA